jgi:MoaA/NifB/PqqE/SkfB family radical SAM enzyme
MAIHVNHNFCIAPFTQLTFGPQGNYSPCAEIGGRPWKDSTASPVSMWTSEEFNQLRNDFLSNTRSKICTRCWDQESHNNQSLRKRLLSQGTGKFQKGELIQYLENQYQVGPKQLNIMVGNKCNLRCRICNAGCSVTYNTEGAIYEKTLGIKTLYTNANKKQIELTSVQIDEIIKISGNLQRIEFYGGEPLLDHPTLELLNKLVDGERSQYITLFYNTNGTVAPSQMHYDLWSKFKTIEFNFSIDDIDGRYTYVRHPATWSDLVNNINEIKNHAPQIQMSFNAISTISAINVYYLPELLDRLAEMNLKTFINTLHGPGYYEITNLPMPVKLQIKEKLLQYHDLDKIQFIINMLSGPTADEQWEWFKKFTKVKDQYRKESFAKAMPEYYQILYNYDNAFTHD